METAVNGKEMQRRQRQWSEVVVDDKPGDESPIDRNKRPRISDEGHLKNYEEAVGYLKSLEVKDSEVAVILSRTCGDDLQIAFPVESPEAEVLTRELDEEPVGQKIGILKNDHPQHPILIRRLPGRR